VIKIFLPQRNIVRQVKYCISHFTNETDEPLNIIIYKTGWMLVAHSCNPSYSGGRDQKDCGLMPARAKSARPYLRKKKKKITERTGSVVQDVGPEFKPEYHKKNV
jgi:hypothetical protein